MRRLFLSWILICFSITSLYAGKGDPVPSSSVGELPAIEIRHHRTPPSHTQRADPGLVPLKDHRRRTVSLREETSATESRLRRLSEASAERDAVLRAAFEQQVEDARRSQELRLQLVELKEKAKIRRAQRALEKAREEEDRATAREAELTRIAEVARLAAEAAKEAKQTAHRATEIRARRHSSFMKLPPLDLDTEADKIGIDQGLLRIWQSRSERKRAKIEGEQKIQRESMMRFFRALPETHTAEFGRNLQLEFETTCLVAASHGMHFTEASLLDEEGDTPFEKLRNLAIRKNPVLAQPDQVGALYSVMAAVFYTTDIGYRAINPKLRNQTHYGSSFMIKAFLEHDWPTYRGVLVRSTHLPPEKVRQLEETGFLTDSAFVSTAVLEAGVPEAFRQGQYRMIILNGRGLDMREFSVYKESEILLLPGTTFRLVKAMSYWGHEVDDHGNEILGKPKYARNDLGQVLYEVSRSGKLQPKLQKNEKGEVEYYADDEAGEVEEGVEVQRPKRVLRHILFVYQICLETGERTGGDGIL